MYSLNVPVPTEVARLAAGLARRCRRAEVRERHTLVAKRLPEGDFGPLARRAREAVAGTPPFAARVAGVDLFRRPPTGPAPVAYLAVESPELVRLHRRLCEEFDPVADLEGDDYVPHVTVARGGDAADLADADVDPVTWQVDRLALYDPGRDLEAESISLPA